MSDRETVLDYAAIACIVITGACVVIAMVCDLLIKHGYGP